MSGTNALMLVIAYGLVFPPVGLDDSPVMLKKKKSHVEEEEEWSEATEEERDDGSGSREKVDTVGVNVLGRRYGWSHLQLWYHIN